MANTANIFAKTGFVAAMVAGIAMVSLAAPASASALGPLGSTAQSYTAAPAVGGHMAGQGAELTLVNQRRDIQRRLRRAEAQGFNVDRKTRRYTGLDSRRLTIRERVERGEQGWLPGESSFNRDINLLGRQDR